MYLTKAENGIIIAIQFFFERIIVMSYKIELHCHTNPVSGCSNIRGQDLVRCYAQAGYAAVHITDHFTSSFFDGQEFTDYLYGYHAAKKEGDKIGVKVYLGAELRYDGCANDYLLFGVTEEFLAGAKELLHHTYPEIFAYCRKNGVLIYQAHPFRDGMTETPPELLDGVEGYNMHPHHRSRNEKAIAYAKEHGLNYLSGSDAHSKEMVGRGGIISDILPNDSKELRDLILSGKYELYHEGELL